MKRVLLGPWMILILLAIGWGPVFIADLVFSSNAEAAGSYKPQAFAMGWLGICFFCSAGALCLAFYHGGRLILRLVRGDDNTSE